MFNFPSKYNTGGDQDEQRKMQLLSLLADLKVKLLKVLILYLSVLQEQENASLLAENALIKRRVDQLEERLNEKDGKTSEEQT